MMLDLGVRLHVDLVVLEILWVGVHHLVLDAALIVASMVTGLEIVRLATGKISVIAVETEVTLKETARTVLRSSGAHTFQTTFVYDLELKKIVSL